MAKYRIVMNDTEAGLEHTITPHVVNGGETTPFHLLLNAVASCNVLVLKNLLEANRVEFSISHVEASGETENSATKKIEVDIFISVKEEDKDKVTKLGTQIPKFCTIVRSLDPNLDIEERIVFE